LSAEERLAKLERLRSEGVDPFPFSFPDRDKISSILEAHDPAELGEGEHSEFSYRIAGRVTGQRGHGKTTFFDVRDLSGTIQAYARVDALGQEEFDRIEGLDIGDLVGVEGDLYVTKRGQLAIEVRECTLLAKALCSQGGVSTLMEQKDSIVNQSDSFCPMLTSMHRSRERHHWISPDIGPLSAPVCGRCRWHPRQCGVHGRDLERDSPVRNDGALEVVWRVENADVHDASRVARACRTG